MKTSQDQKPEFIFKTPDSWGNDNHFFTEEHYDKFVSNMNDCRDGEIEKPITYMWDDDTEAYEYYSHGTSYYARVTDWSDESELSVEEFDTFDINRGIVEI